MKMKFFKNELKIAQNIIKKSNNIEEIYSLLKTIKKKLKLAHKLYEFAPYDDTIAKKYSKLILKIFDDDSAPILYQILNQEVLEIKRKMYRKIADDLLKKLDKKKEAIRSLKILKKLETQAQEKLENELGVFYHDLDSNS